MPRDRTPSLVTKRVDQGSGPAIGPSTKAILSELAHVGEVWEEFQSSRDRDAVYRYLQAVYELVKEWERRGRAKKQMRRALKARGVKAGNGADPFAVAILCTCDASKVDGKTRSKWSRALRYAEAFNRGRELLKGFIKRNGGINGCASRYARRLGRRRSATHDK